MSKKFEREDSHKKKSIPGSWKNPEGKHSRVRLEEKGARPKPKAGYRTNKEERGKHPSGYNDVLVHRPEDLEKLQEDDAARIASGVGGRKRETIIEKAVDNDIKVLNKGGQE